MHLKLRMGLRALAATVAVAASMAALEAKAAVVVYENLPTAMLPLDHSESHHGVGGPILADDFVPALGGTIKKVEWWGSFAQDTRWELAFHTNNVALGQPNIDNAFEGALVKYGENGDILASGVQDVPGHDNIWHYSVNLPVGLALNGGQEYWFTVANFTGGWGWADALAGPTVGSENFNAHQSTGVGACGDGGPHCGPWTDVHTDFAFRLTALPEPGSAALAGLALGLLGVARRSRSSGASAGAAA